MNSDTLWLFRPKILLLCCFVFHRAIKKHQRSKKSRGIIAVYFTWTLISAHICNLSLTCLVFKGDLKFQAIESGFDMMRLFYITAVNFTHSPGPLI